MVCHLFGTEPKTWTDADLLPIGSLGTNFQLFLQRTFIWKCHLQNISHFFTPQCVKQTKTGTVNHFRQAEVERLSQDATLKKALLAESDQMDASRRGSQDSGITNSSTRGSPASSVTHTPQDSPKRVEDNKKVSCDTFQYKDYSLQNKCRTADPDRQNMGHSGMLFFFTIYKFWQNCAWVRRVSDLILKTETLRVNPGMWIDWIPIMLKQSYIYDESTDEIILVRKPSLYLLIVVCIAT